MKSRSQFIVFALFCVVSPRYALATNEAAIYQVSKFDTSPYDGEGRCCTGYPNFGYGHAEAVYLHDKLEDWGWSDANVNMWENLGTDFSDWADNDEDADGYDVSTGKVVLNGATLGRRVIAAYRRAEKARRRRLDALLTRNAIPYATLSGSGDIRRELVALNEVAARAG